MLDIPGEVDVAFIAVPADSVIAVARECGSKGVRGLVVISSGFAETGPDGSSLQHELLEVCRASGMRLIGPNCMGVVNTDPDVRLNAHVRATWPPRGASRSSPRAARSGIAVMGQAARARVGSVDVRVGREQGGHLRQRPL